jgi:hypothetical protein
LRIADCGLRIETGECSQTTGATGNGAKDETIYWMELLVEAGLVKAAKLFGGPKSSPNEARHQGHPRQTRIGKISANIENRENHEIHQTHEKALLSCVSCIWWFSKNVLAEDFGRRWGIALPGGLRTFQNLGGNLLGLNDVVYFRREPVRQARLDSQTFLFEVAIAREEQIHFSLKCHSFLSAFLVRRFLMGAPY